MTDPWDLPEGQTQYDEAEERRARLHERVAAVFSGDRWNRANGASVATVDELADRAIAIVRRSLVEECAAEAKISMLVCFVSTHGGPLKLLPLDNLDPFTPIAAAPRSLAEDVARELLKPTCTTCGHRPTCHIGEPKDMTACDEYEAEDAPPFAAAYTDLADGSKEYVLVSAECEACKGEGVVDTDEPPGEWCMDCYHSGARTDVAKIAARYEPDRRDNTARVARFVVRGS